MLVALGGDRDRPVAGGQGGPGREFPVDLPVSVGADKRPALADAGDFVEGGQAVGPVAPKPARSPEISIASTWTARPARLSPRAVTWSTRPPTAARANASIPTIVMASSRCLGRLGPPGWWSHPAARSFVVSLRVPGSLGRWGHRRRPLPRRGWSLVLLGRGALARGAALQGDIDRRCFAWGRATATGRRTGQEAVRCAVVAGRRMIGAHTTPSGQAPGLPRRGGSVVAPGHRPLSSMAPTARMGSRRW